MSYMPQTVSSNSILKTTSYILADSSAENLVLTLPSPSQIPGRIYLIKKIHRDHEVTITCADAEIDERYEFVLQQEEMGTVELIAAGNWHVLNSMGGYLSVFSPNLISSLRMWYDASDNNTLTIDGSGNVTGWQDKSFSGHDGYQDAEGAHPIVLIGVQNQLNGLYFNGVDDNFKIKNAFDMSQHGTIIIISNTISGGNSVHGDYLVKINNSNDNGRIFIRPYTTQTTITEWSSIGVVNADSTSSMDSSTHCTVGKWEFNGLLSCSVDGNLSPSTTVLGNKGSNTWMGTESRLGSSRTDDINFLECIIYEVLYFEENLSTRDTQILEGYLCHKWGIQSKLPNAHPYKEKPPY